MARTTSMATVKVQKRAKLAEKLKAVFEVSEIEEVIAGTCPCSVWMLTPEQTLFLRTALLAFKISLYVDIIATRLFLC
jgi:hypothetical protein